MTPALWFFVASITVVLLVDLAFELGWLPGGTISDGIWDWSKARPWLVAAAYWVLAGYGAYHFGIEPFLWVWLDAAH